VRTHANSRPAGLFGVCLRAGLLLAVALCVFGWGTGYKLSLYNPAPQHALELKAKFWIKTGDAERNCASASVQAHSPMQSTAQPANYAGPLPMAPITIRHPSSSPPLARDRLAHLFAAALFLRPPPAI
jgi:hypothetical protein